MAPPPSLSEVPQELLLSSTRLSVAVPPTTVSESATAPPVPSTLFPVKLPPSMCSSPPLMSTAPPRAALLSSQVSLVPVTVFEPSEAL